MTGRSGNISRPVRTGREMAAETASREIPDGEFFRDLGIKMASASVLFAKAAVQPTAGEDASSASGETDPSRLAMSAAAALFTVLAEAAGSASLSARLKSELFEAMSAHLYLEFFQKEDRPGGLEYFRLLLSSELDGLAGQAETDEVVKALHAQGDGGQSPYSTEAVAHLLEKICCDFYQIAPEGPDRAELFFQLASSSGITDALNLLA